ncbi:MAG: phosphohistidine phosphatase SixA [bacterium]|nr:phosphohistidine phosphatase SixA [bacterium]
MKLYLMQHGSAMSKEENSARPLSAQGIKDVEKVAMFLSRVGSASQLSEIRHSGKRRAQETAEIVARSLGQQERVIAVDGLNPNDDIPPVAAMLQQEDADLFLVGHLPFLNRLASQLLSGNPERELLQFQPGGVLCLLGQGDWKLCWMLIPTLL